MNTNHNRIKVADLETNEPNKVLKTNENGELEFSDALSGGSQNLQQTLDNGAFWSTPDFSKVVSLFSDMAPNNIVLRAAGLTGEDIGKSGNISVEKERVYMLCTDLNNQSTIMVENGRFNLSQAIQGAEAKITQFRFRPPAAIPGTGGTGAVIFIPAPLQAGEYNLPLKINGYEANNDGNITIDLSHKQDISNQIEVNLPATVQDIWHGKTVKFTGTGILTIPGSFSNPGMCFEGITKTGTTLNWSITSPKTFEFGTPPTVGEKQIFTFMQNEGQHSIMILGL